MTTGQEGKQQHEREGGASFLAVMVYNDFIHGVLF